MPANADCRPTCRPRIRVAFTAGAPPGDPGAAAAATGSGEHDSDDNRDRGDRTRDADNAHLWHLA